MYEVIGEPRVYWQRRALNAESDKAELLAALEAMVEDYQEAYGGGDLDEEPSALKQARAAVAKAKAGKG